MRITQYLIGIFLCLSVNSFADEITYLRQKFNVQRLNSKINERDELSQPLWRFQAFKSSEASLIKKVLESSGGQFYFKVVDLSHKDTLALDEVDVLLYDAGLKELIKNKDPLDRELLIRKIQSSKWSEIKESYNELDERKLRYLFDLFHRN